MNSRVQQFEQDRDDRGRFGSGGGGTGGGLPRADTHAQTEGGGRFEKGTAKEGQVTWAHEKAKEQGKSVYMEPNPKHDPANPKAGDGGPFKLSYKPPKGEHHEVKPDGSMVYHPAPAKVPRGGKGAPKGVTVHGRDDHDTAHADYERDLCAARPRLAFARAIEATVAGAAPEAARLWGPGWNETDKGALNFTPESAKMCLADFAARGNPLAWYYEHEDRVPIAQRGGCPMKGVCSAPSSMLTARPGEGGPELWAERIAWTDEARRQIISGERRQLSPIAAYDEETREIVAILNVSLCAEGATHHGTLLASAGKDTGMDDLKQQILDAIAQGDWESAEALIAQAEGMDDGGGDFAKMARACMTAAKGAPPAAPAGPPPPPAGGAVVARKMAALSRQDLPAGANVEAFNRLVSNMEAATSRADAAAKRSDRQTIVAALSRAMEQGLPVDLVDEREQLAACDPIATGRFLDSLARKRKGGLLLAAKPGAVTEAQPAKPGTAPTLAAAKPVVVDTFGLNEIEMAEAARTSVSFKAFAESRDRVAARGKRGGQQTVKEA